MKFNDAVLGVVFVLFGTAVVWQARSFPTLPHQDYGSALFPSLIGAALAICGLALVAQGVRAKLTTASTWAELGHWVHSPHHVVAVLMIPAGLIVYMLIADWLGFFLTSSLLLFCWMVWLRGRWVSSLLIAVIMTAIIDLGFSHYLLVPLPGGWFQPLSWVF